MVDTNTTTQSNATMLQMMHGNGWCKTTISTYDQLLMLISLCHANYHPWFWPLSLASSSSPSNIFGVTDNHQPLSSESSITTCVTSSLYSARQTIFIWMQPWLQQVKNIELEWSEKWIKYSLYQPMHLHVVANHVVELRLVLVLYERPVGIVWVDLELWVKWSLNEDIRCISKSRLC